MAKKLILLFLILSFSSCSTFYVLKQGFYQADMMLNTTPIEKALRNPGLSKNQRDKLNLIKKVRIFAENILDLKNNKNYKNINLFWHREIYNLSASKPLSFTPYEWWFLIIGHVPYKGFFSLDDLKKENSYLKDLGYETYIYSIPGYSTLGYFSDPIWPSMLKMSDISLTELIIHELLHKSFYLKSQTNFNESLANFVGQNGAKLFFKEYYGENSPKILELKNHYEDKSKKQKFFYSLYKRLDDLYNSDISTDLKSQKKIQILKEEKSNYDMLNILNNMDWSMVNNAYIMSFKRYNDDLYLFEELFLYYNQDLKKFIFDIKTNINNKNPFLKLKERVKFLKEKHIN